MRALALMLFVAFHASAFSDEIRVLSGGAAKSFVESLAASLPGHTVRLEFQPMGRLVQSLSGGAAVDTVYVAVPVPGGGRATAVSAFIDHLTSTQAKERLTSAGYTSPQ